MKLQSIHLKLIATVTILSIFLVVGYIGFIEPYLARAAFKAQYTVQDNNKFKLLMLWASGSGEQELIGRYHIVSQRLGIEYRALATNQFEDKYKKLAHKQAVKKGSTLAEMAIEIMQPDLIVTVQDNIYPYKGAPNYRVLDKSLDQYLHINCTGDVSFINPQINEFSGILTPIDEIAQVKTIFAMSWYPTSYATDYQPKEPTRLFYIGSFWGLRSSDKYLQLIKLLDKQGYLHVAGANVAWKWQPQNMSAKIPYDGVSLIREFNKHGVALLLHDPEHLSGAAPTGRVFEAAAGNAVMISDKHAFIQKHFGDNVLYIDIEKTPEEIFMQIDQHMQWIFSHPEEAKQMANRCHEIFLQKFTLEAQLQQIIKLNQNKTR